MTLILILFCLFQFDTAVRHTTLEPFFEKVERFPIPESEKMGAIREIAVHKNQAVYFLTLSKKVFRFDRHSKKLTHVNIAEKVPGMIDRSSHVRVNAKGDVLITGSYQRILLDANLNLIHFSKDMLTSKPPSLTDNRKMILPTSGTFARPNDPVFHYEIVDLASGKTESKFGYSNRFIKQVAFSSMNAALFGSYYVASNTALWETEVFLIDLTTKNVSPKLKRPSFYIAPDTLLSRERLASENIEIRADLEKDFWNKRWKLTASYVLNGTDLYSEYYLVNHYEGDHLDKNRYQFGVVLSKDVFSGNPVHQQEVIFNLPSEHVYQILAGAPLFAASDGEFLYKIAAVSKTGKTGKHFGMVLSIEKWRLTSKSE